MPPAYRLSPFQGMASEPSPRTVRFSHADDDTHVRPDKLKNGPRATPVTSDPEISASGELLLSPRAIDPQDEIASIGRYVDTASPPRRRRVAGAAAAPLRHTTEWREQPPAQRRRVDPILKRRSWPATSASHGSRSNPFQHLSTLHAAKTCPTTDAFGLYHQQHPPSQRWRETAAGRHFDLPRPGTRIRAEAATARLQQ